MAKPVNFLLNNSEISFELGRKISRDDLYGKIRRIAAKDGKELKRGFVTGDGRLIARDELAYAKLDSMGTPAGNVTPFINGQEARPQPSSFDDSAPLERIDLIKLATFITTDVYPLEVAGGSLQPGLYQTEFSYRKAFEKKQALILVRDDDETFLLVGRWKNAPFIGQNVLYDIFDSDEAEQEDSDEMDFSMF
jgi:hypothetical protein